MKLQRFQTTAKDSIDIIHQQAILQNYYVGVHLTCIFGRLKSKSDLISEPANVLHISEQLLTVGVRTAELHPCTNTILRLAK